LFPSPQHAAGGQPSPVHAAGVPVLMMGWGVESPPPRSSSPSPSVASSQSSVVVATQVQTSLGAVASKPAFSPAAAAAAAQATAAAAAAATSTSAAAALGASAGGASAGAGGVPRRHSAGDLSASAPLFASSAGAFTPPNASASLMLRGGGAGLPPPPHSAAYGGYGDFSGMPSPSPSPEVPEFPPSPRSTRGSAPVQPATLLRRSTVSSRDSLDVSMSHEEAALLEEFRRAVQLSGTLATSSPPPSSVAAGAGAAPSPVPAHFPLPQPPQQRALVRSYSSDAPLETLQHAGQALAETTPRKASSPRVSELKAPASGGGPGDGYFGGALPARASPLSAGAAGQPGGPQSLTRALSSPAETYRPTPGSAPLPASRLPSAPSPAAASATLSVTPSSTPSMTPAASPPPQPLQAPGGAHASPAAPFAGQPVGYGAAQYPPHAMPLQQQQPQQWQVPPGGGGAMGWGPAQQQTPPRS